MVYAMQYYGGNDYRDYLSHHGVKGMKWGYHLFGEISSRIRSERDKKVQSSNAIANTKKAWASNHFAKASSHRSTADYRREKEELDIANRMRGEELQYRTEAKKATKDANHKLAMLYGVSSQYEKVSSALKKAQGSLTSGRKKEQPKTSAASKVRSAIRSLPNKIKSVPQKIISAGKALVDRIVNFFTKRFKKKKHGGN